MCNLSNGKCGDDDRRMEDHLPGVSTTCWNIRPYHEPTSRRPS